MTPSEANLITGGLSFTSKMPCPSFSLPASACKTGAKLAAKPGTVCSKCYANRGNYRFNNVQLALQLRLDLLEHWQKEDPGVWVEAFAVLLENCRYFRWHDSGDVQGKAHFHMIKAVAEALPNTMFWLPTHEVWVSKQGGIPTNLIIRLSATMVDGPPSKSARLTATVHKHTDPHLAGEVCPAPGQGNQCGSCRKCWDADVKNVAYKYH